MRGLALTVGLALGAGCAIVGSAEVDANPPPGGDVSVPSSEGGGVDGPAHQFTIQGVVRGLRGSGLVLKNGGELLTIVKPAGPPVEATPEGGLPGPDAGGDASVDGGAEMPMPPVAEVPFAFTTSFSAGATYTVEVATQPKGPAQTCTVTHGEGTLSTDAASVVVTCVPRRFSVGGTVYGLVPGAMLSLSLNGTESLNLTTMTPGHPNFSFATKFVRGEPFDLKLGAHPGGLYCDVIPSTGVVGDADVKIDVRCNERRPNVRLCLFEESQATIPDLTSWIPPGVTFNVINRSCVFDASTQAVFMTHGSRVSQMDPGLLRAYLDGGGIVVNSFIDTNFLWLKAFDVQPPAGQQVNFGVSCNDLFPSVVQFTPGDPFWIANAFIPQPREVVGCGQDVGHFPGITPIAGWSPTEVAVGYRNRGNGRVWAASFDWDYGEFVHPPYSAGLMGYMMTHRR